MLTDAECKNATCPPDKSRAQLACSGGLYLEVRPAGSALRSSQFTGGHILSAGDKGFGGVIWRTVVFHAFLIQPKLLNFASDGVAPYAQLVGGFNTAAVGGCQCCLNQSGFKAARQHVPHIAATAVE